jgi:hypothetical protein
MSTAFKPQIDQSTDQSLPNSRRIYINGQQPGVRVPFREIDQNATRNFKNELEENPAVRVYETAGPYGDPSIKTDVREGLAQLRREWIINRGDVEEYEGRSLQPIDDGYLTFEAAQTARDKGRLEDFPTLRRTPLRAKKGSCVTQMYYARRGIITPEMEFIAIRENLGRVLECGDSSPLSVGEGKALTSQRTPNFADGTDIRFSRTRYASATDSRGRMSVPLQRRCEYFPASGPPGPIPSPPRGLH